MKFQKNGYLCSLLLLGLGCAKVSSLEPQAETNNPAAISDRPQTAALAFPKWNQGQPDSVFAEQARMNVKTLGSRYKACLGSRRGSSSTLGQRIGYFQGMTLAFARSVCRDNDLIKTMMLKGNSHDVIGNYQRRNLLKVSYRPDNFDDRVLIGTYSVLLAHGLKESDGDYRDGPDLSARNYSADTSEAGLFQTSNNVGALLSPDGKRARTLLQREYRADEARSCMVETFKVGLNPKKKFAAVRGRGAGADYQAFVRRCPGYAAEEAAITVRHGMHHYGPLIRGSGAPMPACYAVLEEIYRYVDQNRSSLCSAFLIPTDSKTQMATTRE